MRQRTNASFHDFTKTPLFVGEFTGEKLVRQETDLKDKNKKKGDLMGYHFTDGDGMEVLVSASATISEIMEGNKEKKIEPIKKGTVMSFDFQGQGKTKAGRTFNRYRVLEFDSWEEAKSHHLIS